MAHKPVKLTDIVPDDTPFEEIRKRASSEIKALEKTEGPPVEQGDAQMTIFEGIRIRQVFDKGEWRFAIVDIIAALTDTAQPSRYWSDLKSKLVKDEGFGELFDKIEPLRMEAADGKHYLTESANAETILRIIQSIPTKKAEPFKRWLAQVGYERIQEIQDPEIAVKRAILMWQAQGRTSDWIEARLRCIVVRKELTDEWLRGGISGAEYGRLTNIISKETFDLDTAQHKSFKGLGPKHNLRDHMTDLELVFTMLGEKSTAAIARASQATGFQENATAARSGGRVAGDARRDLENRLKQTVVSRDNFLTESRKKDPERLTKSAAKKGVKKAH